MSRWKCVPAFPGSPWYVVRHRFYSSPLLLHSNESAPQTTAGPRFSRRVARVSRRAPLLFNWILHPLRPSPTASEPRVCLSVNLSTAAGWRPVACVGVCAAGTQREQMDFRGGFLILCINAPTTLEVVFHLTNLDCAFAFSFALMFLSKQLSLVMDWPC